MVDLDTKNWTYGAEHEWADWDQRQIPQAFGIDRDDVTIVNSNGIAADPSGKLYPYGGEINTPPTVSTHGQVQVLTYLKEHFPEATVNYRSNLHIHVRVPGLKQDLEMLKKLQAYTRDNLPAVLPLIEPIPRPTKEQYIDPEEYKGAMRRYARRKKSHQTLVPAKRVELQLAATSIQEFFEFEAPFVNGKPMWFISPRAAVNIRQLLETDTIEFRHFPGTLDEDEMLTCVEWCRDYLLAALFTEQSAFDLYVEKYKDRKFPTFPPYIHWMEVRYRQTCHDGTLTKEQIKDNIERILNESHHL